jgi:hypothetical protein
MERRRIKHRASFEDRLVVEATRFKAAAEEQPSGSQAREFLCVALDKPKPRLI